MTAYDASQWSDLFVATAGASAALAGLLFVAVSINIDRVLQFEGLPERALASVLLLLGVVLVSVIGLIPGQSSAALGAELLGQAVVFGVVIARATRASLAKARREHTNAAAQVVLLSAGTLPFVVGGASLLAEAGGGLYWTAAGICFALAGAVTNAWVLLVEILR